MKDRLKNLDYLFYPKSIAFVGATENLGKWGFIVFNNILSGGFAGEVYPVNPGRDTVLDLKAYPSVRDIPGEVDLALFTVPAPQVIAAIDDCVAKGVKAGVVISAGFKEMGGKRADLEAELVAKARAGGMVLVGPNGQGVSCPGHKLYSWMPLFYPPPGKVAVLSQSGNVQSLIIGRILGANFGFSKGVSSGNEADLKTEDFLEYFAHDPETEVIVSYVEGVLNGRCFLDAARAVTRRKPLVILQGGRTTSGQAAAASHTGAMAVSDHLFEAGCRQAGVVLARTIDDAGVIAASFINRPLPQGNRIGIITGGGGLGVVASDICTKEGLEVARLSQDTLDEIGKLMPDWWVPGNPIDTVGGMRFETYRPIIEIMVKSGEVDAIMLLLMGPSNLDKAPRPQGTRGVDMTEAWGQIAKDVHKQVRSLYALMTECNIPLYPISNRDDAANIRKEDKGLMTHRTIGSACRTIKAMAQYAEYRSNH